MILGTAGHIDHGKTALVKSLTGVDTDRLPEEKRRGITIDLGFAPLELEGIGTVGVVDVPGHEAFVRTMLAGASGIDAALLVIAADEGVMPQTREHLEILSLLDVTNIVVAITKTDLVDKDWLPLLSEEVESLFRSVDLEPPPTLPVSAATGEGVADLKSELINSLKRARRNRGKDDLFRMPIDRAFSVRGTGTVVTGTVWSGSLQKDATVFARPGGRTLRVRGIQTHGHTVECAAPGQRTAIALANCDVAELERGMVIVNSRAWIPTKRMLVQLRLAPNAPPLNTRTRVSFHLGTAEIEARLSFAPSVHSTDNSTIARIALAEPVIARSGDRFVLRLPAPVSTIGGGIVLDPYPSAKSTRRIAVSQSFDALTLVRAALDAAGTEGIDVSLIPVRFGILPDESAAVAIQSGGEVIDGRLVSRSAIESLTDRLVKKVDEVIANSPLEPGVQLQTLRAELRSPAAVIDRVLLRLIADGRLELDGALVRPAGWSPSLSERQLRARDDVLHEICSAPSDPPSVAELEARVGPEAPALLRLLTRSGELVKVSEERYYSKRAVSDLVGKLRGTLDPGRFYPPSELRDLLGISRKFLIPFLEYCDRNGITERGASGRRLLATKVTLEERITL